MLDRAARLAGDGVRFEQADLAGWTSAADYDIVLANASLQWVPDHETVLARWTDALKPGGQLAVQVPANGTHASHVVANEVGATAPFLSAMGGSVPVDPSAANVLPPERYAELLFELGYEAQHVALRVYPHVLRRSADVVEWVRGTNLNRFFEQLPPDLHERFVEAYRSALLEHIGAHEPYLYAFKRILMWARRPG
jgi:trans-aconitate 2-methyltransferase